MFGHLLEHDVMHRTTPVQGSDKSGVGSCTTIINVMKDTEYKMDSSRS